MASRKCACCLVVLSLALLTGGWAPPGPSSDLALVADDGYIPVKKAATSIPQQPAESGRGGFQTYGGVDCNSNGIDDALETGAAGVVGSDDCEGAPAAKPGVTYSDTLVGATNDGSSTCGSSSGSNTGPDVWFKYTPVHDGSLTVQLCPSLLDTACSLHSGCPGTTDNQLSCNDDSFICGFIGTAPDVESRVSYAVTGGTTYYIRIAGFDGATGDYSMSITSGPPVSGDCNANDVPDDCDIESGDSEDCNTNGILDECEQADGEGGGEFVLAGEVPGSAFSAIANQFGGVEAEGVDDFVIDGPRRIDSVQFQTLDTGPFVWDGQIQVNLYADAGGQPSDEPIRTVTVMGADASRVLYLDRPAPFTTDVWLYSADVDIDIPFGATWWIGARPGGNIQSFSCVNQRSVDPDHPIVGSEAFWRGDSFGVPDWAPGSVQFGQGMGMAITINLLKGDCNDNNVPDECDIESGGSEDTNDDDIPDECQDCNTNDTPDPVEVGFADCNTNNLADFCDVGFGSAQDCDGDGVLDVCEFVDCNTNNLLDSCDVGFGSVVDCDTNGTPDECGPDCNTNEISDLCDLNEGLDTDCDTDSVPDRCEDCNNNNLNDTCETAFGSTADCDGNGVPDFCDAAAFDCNMNGIPDSCDANGGTSTDCNENAAPDECEIPAEDDCDDARQITSGIVYKANILDATTEDGHPAPTCGDAAVQPDKWWVYTPQASGDVTVTMCGPVDFWDTVISVYEGPCVGTQVGCGDDECGEVGSGNFGVATFTAVFGETYLIRVNPFAANTDVESGDYQIQVIGPPGSSDAGDENGNGVPDVCDFADCNTNLVDDLLDIAEGGSEDCNTNLVPDECDDNPDCNGNGELDVCEEDCNDNGVPDDCDGFVRQNDTDVSIPDGGAPPATSDISIALTGPVGDVNVTVDVRHTWIEDVEMSVSHSGTTVLLSSDNGASGDNYTGTVFDQDALTPITAGTAPFTGTFIPEGNLDDFNGGETSGAWTLTIGDDSMFDTGTLLGWSLSFDTGGLVDCNTNGVLDECDIADGNSVDGNGNGIPDECEAVLCATCAGDTNGDGLTDGDDIAGFVGCVITGVGCGCTDTDGDGATADVDTADDVAAFVTLLLTDDDLVCGP